MRPQWLQAERLNRGPSPAEPTYHDEPRLIPRHSTLREILRPRSIAVIGASDRAGSVGNAVFRNLIESEFRGSVTPVNLNRTGVHGRPSCATIADVPAPVDLAIICTPAATVPGLVRECGDAKVKGVLILSAGFREAGTAGRALEVEAAKALARYPHMRAIGPNCLGLIVPAIGLNASFANGPVKPGRVALFSQSGALCTAMLAWGRDEEVGFSCFLSVGNMLDVGFADLLDYAAEDPDTAAVVLYIEAVTEGREFVEAARRCSAKKPVIAYKAGRHAAAAKAAASHTGAMAGEDAVYQAAFDQAGIVRVNRLDELLGIAELLGKGRRPRGSCLAIVTNAGGPGVIATDALLSAGGKLASLSDQTMRSLNEALPGHWSHANPVDVIGDAGPERMAKALDCVLGDEGVDAALVIVTPQAMIDTAAAAWALAEVAARQAKPVLAAWMVGAGDEEARAALRYAGIPDYDTPEEAVAAFTYMARYAEFAERRGAETSSSCSSAASVGPAGVAHPILDERTGTLNEPDSKAVLSAYGIPVLPITIAGTSTAAVAAARAMGYPVVLKLISPEVTHKTDVGGVCLDLRSDEEVAAAFSQIRTSLEHIRPQATFSGVTVQPMLDCARGVELIVGGRRDPTFGPVVMVGAGGIAAEVANDRAVGLAPVSRDRALELLGTLRVIPMLRGFRGRPPLDEAAVATIVVQMSRLIACEPQVQEAEANPVLVTPDHVLAVDERVVLADASGSTPTQNLKT